MTLTDQVIRWISSELTSNELPYFSFLFQAVLHLARFNTTQAILWQATLCIRIQYLEKINSLPSATIILKTYLHGQLLSHGNTVFALHNLNLIQFSFKIKSCSLPSQFLFYWHTNTLLYTGAGARQTSRSSSLHTSKIWTQCPSSGCVLHKRGIPSMPSPIYCEVGHYLWHLQYAKILIQCQCDLIHSHFISFLWHKNRCWLRYRSLSIYFSVNIYQLLMMCQQTKELKSETVFPHRSSEIKQTLNLK